MSKEFNRNADKLISGRYMFLKSDKINIQDLLALIQEGNDNAFQKLREYYRPLITNKCIQYSDSLEKDEIEQIALIGLFDAAQSYRKEKANGKVTFGLYASICINNRIVSEIRKLKPTAPLDGIPEADLELSAEDVFINKESFQYCLDDAEAHLSDYELQVLMSIISGNTYKQTALSLGRTEKSVECALSRARSKLRAKAKQ